MSEGFYISDSEDMVASPSSPSILRQTSICEHFSKRVTISPSPSTSYSYPVQNYRNFSYHFFEDTTLYFSYFLSLHTLPTDEKILEQFGFMKCQNAYERNMLLHVYFHVIFVANHPESSPFLYKRLQELYHVFLQDRLKEYIMIRYGQIHDDAFYWFVHREDVVKHHQCYETYLHLKDRYRSFFLKNVV
jgi:hypothetical protein